MTAQHTECDFRVILLECIQWDIFHSQYCLTESVDTKQCVREKEPACVAREFDAIVRSTALAVAQSRGILGSRGWGGGGSHAVFRSQILSNGECSTCLHGALSTVVISRISKVLSSPLLLTLPLTSLPLSPVLFPPRCFASYGCFCYVCTSGFNHGRSCRPCVAEENPTRNSASRRNPGRRALRYVPLPPAFSVFLLFLFFWVKCAHTWDGKLDWLHPAPCAEGALLHCKCYPALFVHLVRNGTIGRR